jgi:hypothetical protein
MLARMGHLRSVPYRINHCRIFIPTLDLRHNSVKSTESEERGILRFPNSSGESFSIRLPGYQLPPDHYGRVRLKNNKNYYPLAICGQWVSDGITLREIRMLEFMGNITDKPGWEKKVYDEGIVAKWRKEADARPAGLEGDVYLSEKMFDFVCHPVHRICSGAPTELH